MYWMRIRWTNRYSDLRRVWSREGAQLTELSSLVHRDEAPGLAEGAGGKAQPPPSGRTPACVITLQELSCKGGRQPGPRQPRASLWAPL